MEKLALITKQSALGNILNSLVFKCEKCGHEIRLIVARFTDKTFNSKCCKCNYNRKFVFERRGNEGDDWIVTPYLKKSNVEGINKN